MILTVSLFCPVCPCRALPVLLDSDEVGITLLFNVQDSALTQQLTRDSSTL